jgi:heme exporter protein A
VISRLVVEDLTLARGEQVLFENLSFEAAAGEAFALTGPNGSGKTSLLRAIAGFIRPTEGRIRFFGTSGEELEAQDVRAEALHLLGHQDGLKPARTLWEELRFQALWAGGSEAQARSAAHAFGLKPLLDLEIRKLSAGQRRRTALARLAAAPRPLWLLDEPLAPLDAQHRRSFGEVMAKRLEDGGLILAAVHDPLPVPAHELSLGASA